MVSPAAPRPVFYGEPSTPPQNLFANPFPNTNHVLNTWDNQIPQHPMPPSPLHTFASQVPSHQFPSAPPSNVGTIPAFAEPIATPLTAGQQIVYYKHMKDHKPWKMHKKEYKMKVTFST
jgi:hypothetical protein